MTKTALIILTAVITMLNAETIPFYIGTYTSNTKSRGIYRSELDLQTGEMSEPQLAAETLNPSFVAVNHNGSALYAVSKTDSEGRVNAFNIVESTGELEIIDSQSSKGVSPCYVSIDPSGSNLLIANYSSGSITVLPIGKDARVEPPACSIAHEGKSENAKRQEAPHAHSIITSPDGRYVFAADLGIDKIMVYKLDKDAGKLTPAGDLFAKLRPGSGPRHMAFHPNGKFFYVINELNSTITAFGYDYKTAQLSEIETITTLPRSFSGTNLTAQICVHPSGKYLYGSNRGHDSIAAYQINSGNGTLSLIEIETDGINEPRNFNIEPNGNFLVCANQHAGSLITFRIDFETGKLEKTPHKINVPSPVCVDFVIKEKITSQSETYLNRTGF
ncbi:6-phosphogluconolactonase [Limihaloglobus sulfuriphilus]|uniref:6-phosphogluconolactonase n=1 Tax=Limihaloglobus sulfuriphilus TaxID=1851148 RepID=A0A1Q2MH60_9BACT|nr:lactonase family protein [Limihaloglobus sulfuriphilus]AQQ71989.1 6-phosphogluconolactonase [Limihaloglobus sulfuriphilus]